MIRFIGVVALAVALGSAAQAQSFDCQKAAAKPATKIGAYTFRQVCKNTGRGDHEQSVSYPQIVGGDAAAAKWNALAAKTAQSQYQDGFDTADVSYNVGIASAKLISVHFDSYANTQGTAHPTTGFVDMNVTMPAAAPLKASDLFKVTPQWKAFMAKQLGDGFVKIAGMSLKDASIDNAKLTSQATDPEYWFIDAKGLTIETGDLVDSPNSDIEATISWAALKPYLAVPIP